MFNDYFTRLLLDHCQEVSASGKVDEATLEEISMVAKFVSSDDSKYIKNSELLRKGVEYLTTDFAKALNALNKDFYALSYNERMAEADKIWSVDREVDKALKKLLVNFSYQEIVRNIQELLEVAYESPFVVVQTPLEIGHEQKTEMMEKISKEINEPVIVQFQVNKAILGGMRVFVDGQVQDMSWMGRIEKIANLNI
jgi:F0F1-type ATP synthase delta subunit